MVASELPIDRGDPRRLHPPRFESNQQRPAGRTSTCASHATLRVRMAPAAGRTVRGSSTRSRHLTKRPSSAAGRAGPSPPDRAKGRHRDRSSGRLPPPPSPLSSLPRYAPHGASETKGAIRSAATASSHACRRDLRPGSGARTSRHGFDAHFTVPLVGSPLRAHATLQEGLRDRSATSTSRSRFVPAMAHPSSEPVSHPECETQRATRPHRRPNLRKPEPEIAGGREGRCPDARRAHLC